MLSSDFLDKFKQATEKKWRQQSIDPTVYGFQFRPGTRWNPGLPEDKVVEFENVLGVRFPYDFKAFLRVMNGTDIPTLNVYGSSGEPARESVGVYSYPRDVEIIQQRINDVRSFRHKAGVTLAEQGFELAAEASLVPIYGHRYVVCVADLSSSAVVSIEGTDAIVYGNSLKEYLEREFLRD